MTSQLELPPQPDPTDFGPGEYMRYTDALKAWRDVCIKVCETNERIASSQAFWRKS